MVVIAVFLSIIGAVSSTVFVKNIFNIEKQGSPWDPSIIEKAEELANQLDFESLISETYGHGGVWQGDVPELPQYNLPFLHEQDSPQGVAGGFLYATCFPTSSVIAQTWDVIDALEFGTAMGIEQRAKGSNVVLAPAVNIGRIPWGGRLWEYLGEDPFLTSNIAYNIVRGLQSQNITGCIKHFALNNQETDRKSVSANVDRRTAMELYFPSFEVAINAGIGSIMCSYNRINGTYSCENNSTMYGVLREKFGFKGWIRSDGWALVDTVQSANNGCDQEMPSQVYYGPPLAEAVKANEVPEWRLKQMNKYIFTTLFALNMVSNPITDGDYMAFVITQQHRDLARKLAAKGAVLLKNENNFLPLKAENIKSVSVFGDELITGGIGSGGVSSYTIVTPFQGIYNYFNGDLPSRGQSCTTYNDTDFYQPGEDVCVTASSVAECSSICLSITGCHAFSYVANKACPGSHWGNRCWLKPTQNGEKVSTGVIAGVCPDLPSPLPSENATVLYGGKDAASAGNIAKTTDVAIVVVAITADEGSDRSSLDLPKAQNDLVSAVAAANPNTIVIAKCPGPCLMPWLNDVSAVIFAGLAGAESGNAIADNIFGATPPEGRLVYSFPNSMNDTWLSLVNGGEINPIQYPGTDRGKGFKETDYIEQLNVGYRYYDSYDLNPLFPFGYGLSYTNYTYSNLEVLLTNQTIDHPYGTVSLTVTNSGYHHGTEVVQLYVGFPEESNSPPKQLKGFYRTKQLQPGESAKIIFEVSHRSFAIFDVITDQWIVVPGTYQIYLGSSSRDIHLRSEITISRTNNEGE